MKLIYLSISDTDLYKKLNSLPKSKVQHINIYKSKIDQIQNSYDLGKVHKVITAYVSVPELYQRIKEYNEDGDVLIFTDISLLSTIYFKTKNMELNVAYIKTGDEEVIEIIRQIFQTTKAKAKDICEKYEFKLSRIGRDKELIKDCLDKKKYIRKPRLKIPSYNDVLLYVLGSQSVDKTDVIEVLNKYNKGFKKLKKYLLDNVEVLIKLTTDNIELDDKKVSYVLKDFIQSNEINLTTEQLILLSEDIRKSKTNLDLIRLKWR